MNDMMAKMTKMVKYAVMVGLPAGGLYLLLKYVFNVNLPF